MSTRFRNTLAVFVLTGSLALAGCGSDSKEAKETSTPGTSTSQQAQGETTSAAPDAKTSAAQGTTVPDGYKEVHRSYRQDHLRRPPGLGEPRRALRQPA
mgnify:CR=1 FL=1